MSYLLVIDDDKDILGAVELLLQTCGHEVTSLSLGQEAIETARRLRPDLIILDYLMAGSNGIEICHTLKKCADTSQIPVIIFSAHPSARTLAQHSGADSFVAKPFSISEMLDEVNKYIGAIPAS